ncbi:MAG: imidazolonepropionase [Hyphomicrobiales bacterium]
MILGNGLIATMDSHPGGAPYGLLAPGWIRIENGRIADVGAAGAGAPVADIDLGGRLVTPGLIDCHTHLVYAGSRADEFEKRLNGATYEEIARAGGGIVSTVRATRAASRAELLATALPRLKRLMDEGATTVEIKSGYGLDLDTEVRCLTVARLLGELLPVTIVTSYLGAHALPPEHGNDRSRYVDLICNEVLPVIAREKLADAVDAFCEKIAFTAEEVDRIFTAARSLGLPVKLHAEQLSDMGGALVAARHKALSVDHIEYLPDSAAPVLAASGTVAVLLPGAFYYLRETKVPPVEALRKAGVLMAVSTDLNPGSSPVNSLLATLNMACVQFRLTPEEALRGVTVNAAKALGLADRGRVAPGLRADLAVWNIARPGDLCHPLGVNPCHAVLQGGRIVKGAL